MLPGNLLHEINSHIVTCEEDYTNIECLATTIAFMKATGARCTSDWGSNRVQQFTRSFPRYE